MQANITGAFLPTTPVQAPVEASANTGRREARRAGRVASRAERASASNIQPLIRQPRAPLDQVDLTNLVLDLLSPSSLHCCRASLCVDVGGR